MATPNPLSAREFFALPTSRVPFIPELHQDDCPDVDCVRCVDEPQIASRGRALLDAKAAADAEATHWRRLGMTPPAEGPRDADGGAR